ncbi:hypothetical protein SynWH8101_0870 [Synechococcus sp. WH 8101]|nr:hypothetical protein SynWH8101_0870 [Synechococcus sp. WH 8101]
MATVHCDVVSEAHPISPAQRLEQHSQDAPTLAQQVIARELAGRREGSQALEMMLQAMGTMVQAPRSTSARRWSAAR